MGAHKSVLERQQAVLPIVGGASIGTLHRLFLTSGCTLFECVDDESEEERYGKDRDKEVHDQAGIRGHANPQTLHSSPQALPHPWWALAGVETAQILASSCDIQDAGSQFLLVLGWGSSCTP